MGFWKRLFGHEEEGANPFGQPDDASVEIASSTSMPPPGASASTPLLSFESAPMQQTWTSVTVNGEPVPPEQAEAFTKAFEQLGNVANFESSQVIDLRDVPGLRGRVLGAMHQHAGDPTALQGAVFEALRESGVAPADPQAAAAAAAGDPVDRIKKLDELRDQGLLSDAEFEAQKKKLLDEI